MDIQRKGINNFQHIVNLVIKKILELKDCKQIVKDSVIELTKHSKNLDSILLKLRKNASELELRQKLLRTTGVSATTLGSSLAAALWASAYFSENGEGYSNFLAWIATSIGIGGTILKMGTSYFCSKLNKNYMLELEHSLHSSHHGKELANTEKILKSKFTQMLEIVKVLYGPTATSKRKRNKIIANENILRNRREVLVSESNNEEKEPLVVSIMETADSATCAPDVISTVIDYSSELGLESFEIIEETYEAASASLSEVISYGVFEGVANGLSLVMSSYEIYRLIGAWKKENPTVEKITEIIEKLETKIKLYNNLRKCIEVVDVFSKLSLARRVIKK